MDFIKNIKRQSSASRLTEELLYEKVTQELAQGVQRNGLMAKAVADANGDPNKTQALYIKYRVRSMHDEAELESAIREQERANRNYNARAAGNAKNIREENEKIEELKENNKRKKVEKRAKEQYEKWNGGPPEVKSTSMKVWGVIKLVAAFVIVVLALNYFG